MRVGDEFRGTDKEHAIIYRIKLPSNSAGNESVGTRTKHQATRTADERITQQLEEDETREEVEEWVVGH